MTNQRLRTVLGILTVLCFSGFVSPSLLSPELLDVRNSIYKYSKESNIRHALITGNYPDDGSDIIDDFGITIAPHIADTDIKVTAFKNMPLFDYSSPKGASGCATGWHMLSILEMRVSALKSSGLSLEAVAFNRFTKLPSSTGLFKHYFADNSNDGSTCSLLLAYTSPQAWREFIIQVCVIATCNLVLPVIFWPDKNLLNIRTLLQSSKFLQDQQKSSELYAMTNNLRAPPHYAKLLVEVSKQGYRLIEVFLHIFKVFAETKVLPSTAAGLEVFDFMLYARGNPTTLSKQLHFVMKVSIYTSHPRKTKFMPETATLRMRGDHQDQHMETFSSASTEFSKFYFLTRVALWFYFATVSHIDKSPFHSLVIRPSSWKITYVQPLSQSINKVKRETAWLKFQAHQLVFDHNRKLNLLDEKEQGKELSYNCPHPHRCFSPNDDSTTYDVKDVGQIKHTNTIGSDEMNHSGERSILAHDRGPAINLYQSGIYTTIHLETGNIIFDVVANPSDTPPVSTDSDQITRLNQLDVAALFCATTIPSDSDDPDPPEPEPIGEGQPN